MMGIVVEEVRGSYERGIRASKGNKRSKVGNVVQMRDRELKEGRQNEGRQS